MSSDENYIIRKNGNGKFVLQVYCASADSYPDVERAGSANTFDTLEEAFLKYNKLDSGMYRSEYGLSLNLYTQPKEESKKMETRKYNRKPFEVEAVQVTDDNMGEVAAWCGGTLQGPPRYEKAFIKVNVRNPLNPKQTEAHVGDWVLLGRQGFKVYTDSAFKKNFEEPQDGEKVVSHQVTNVFSDFSSTHPLPNPQEKFLRDAIRAQHRMSAEEFNVFNNGDEPVTDPSPDASDQQ